MQQCESPSCSKFGMPMTLGPNEVGSHGKYYSCNGEMLEGSGYTILNDLVRSIVTTSIDKKYTPLLRLLLRAAAQTQLIIQDQSNDD